MITFTIALHGKHAWECWWKIVTATTASAMGGPLIIRATGKMPSRPLAKGELGRAFKAISPGMLPPLGIIFGLFVAFTGRFIHGNEVSPGNLCREPAAVA
jgi:hypothetical protein